MQNSRFLLRNPHPDVLHIRLAPGAPYLAVCPTEAALGPNELQSVSVRTDIAAARAAIRDGAAPGASVQLLYQRLGTHESNSPATPSRQASIHVHLPISACPSCGRSLDSVMGEGGTRLDVCPFCFERLRPCPVCGAPNSWLARRCALDASHVVRSSPDWGMLGGSPGHDGARPARAVTALSRRWSFPSVPPARRENALTWSAPAAAYGMVAAAATSADGDAHIYAFDARNGAPLYDPYTLSTPVYPDRGGIAIADGRLYAATIEGTCFCLDALRGTRLWETKIDGRVFGAVVPMENGSLLVAASAADGTGRLYVLDGKTGAVLQTAPLDGTPDAAPAAFGDTAFVHTDAGTVAALDTRSGAPIWSASCGAGFDAAPVVQGGTVLSANTAGVIRRFDAATGAVLWELSVTNAPFVGTPACDGSLLYAPADDGLHLVSIEGGRAVRKYGIRQPVRSAPVISGGTLFFGGTDGCVYGAAPSQALERLYEPASIGAQIIAAPAYADDALFVTSTNGVLYALGLGGGGERGGS